MKILIATPLYPPDIGGPATYGKLLHDELPKRGVSVSVVSFGEVRSWPRGVRHLIYFFKLLQALPGTQAILAQDPISTGLPALLAARLGRKKFLIRVAGDYAWEQAVQRWGVKDSIDDFQNRRYGLKTEFVRWIQKFVVRRADRVITPSHYFGRLVAAWGPGADKITVIYNGIKLADLPASVEDWSRRSQTIISAGRLVPWKGFSELVDLVSDLPEWRLIIVGDGPERLALEKQILFRRVADRVTLLGQVPPERLFSLLTSAGVFILNTAFESFSFLVVEAMDAGIPVITTTVGSLPELITDNQEGILVKPNDTVTIKRALQRIISENEWRQALIHRARQKAREFSIDATMANLEKLLKDLKLD